MTVESVTYIDDLNASYPASTDSRSEGDDHIRNIKQGIKASFPQITGAVTATQDELNKLDGATVSTAEINYLSGVTSNIQEQFDDKAAISHTHAAIDLTLDSTDLGDYADLTYNYDTDVSGNSWVIDDDTMATATDQVVSTAESVKAYVDSQIGSGGVGKVLQVVSAEMTANYALTSSVTNVTGLEVSITPSSTSSTILLICTFNASGVDTTDGASSATGYLANGTTAVSGIGGTAQNIYANRNITNAETHSKTIIGIDAPASTSAQTYRLRANESETDDTVQISARGSIVAMEIAG